MSRTISVRHHVRNQGTRTIRITPHWAGKGLALHKPVIMAPETEESVLDHVHVFDHIPGLWVVTHIHSGMAAGRFMGSLDRAKAFARQWDEAWAAVASKDQVPAKLRKEYLAALAAASGGPSRRDLVEAGV